MHYDWLPFPVHKGSSDFRSRHSADPVSPNRCLLYLWSYEGYGSRSFWSVSMHPCGIPEDLSVSRTYPVPIHRPLIPPMLPTALRLLPSQVHNPGHLRDLFSQYRSSPGTGHAVCLLHKYRNEILLLLQNSSHRLQTQPTQAWPAVHPLPEMSGILCLRMLPSRCPVFLRCLVYFVWMIFYLCFSLYSSLVFSWLLSMKPTPCYFVLFLLKWYRVWGDFASGSNYFLSYIILFSS